MIDRFSEVPDEDAREEHARRAEATPFTFTLPSAIPNTHTKASTPTAWAMGCVLWSSKSQFIHPSAHGRRGFHLGARACSVSLEVLVEEAGEFFCGGSVGGFVGPAFTRAQDF
jgi:hypothetical protein